MSTEDALLEALLEAIAACKLEALVIGNTAAILHGVPVTTLDADLLVRSSKANDKKVQQVADRLGAVVTTPFEPISSVRRLEGYALPIDIMIPPADRFRFESLRSRAESIALGSQVALVASLADVIDMKRAADRPKDRAVMPMLEAALAVQRTRRGLPAARGAQRSAE